MSVSQPVRHVFRAAPELFRIGFAEIFAYRAEMVVWILSATMPLIMLALWNSVVSDAPIEGFGPTEITRYFAATLIVRQLTSAWLLWHLNVMIRTGSLSPKLLRPLNPLVYEGVTMLVAMPLRLVVLAPLVIGLVVWRPELLVFPGFVNLALFCVAVAMAWLLNFLFQAAFGCLAFWTDQSQGLFGLYMSFWMLLSGYVAPLEMFPSGIRAIISWLPFRGMIAVPVELLGGFLTPGEALSDLALMAVWIAVLLGVVRWMWLRGLQRYGAFGA